MSTEMGTWFHFLFGTKPSEGIDWIYIPKAADDDSFKGLYKTQFKNVVNSIEPLSENYFAFSISNLSLKDTQRIQGRGCLALSFVYRIKASHDQMGRRRPLLVYGAALVDQEVTPSLLFDTSWTLYEIFNEKSEQSELRYIDSWYHDYSSSTEPEGNASSLIDFVISPSLPSLAQSAPIYLYNMVDESKQQGRLLSVEFSPQEHLFKQQLHIISRAATVLYYSDLEWSTITTGKILKGLPGLSLVFQPENPNVTKINHLHISQFPKSLREIANFFSLEEKVIENNSSPELFLLENNEVSEAHHKAQDTINTAPQKADVEKQKQEFPSLTIESQVSELFLFISDENKRLEKKIILYNLIFFIVFSSVILFFIITK